MSKLSTTKILKKGDQAEANKAFELGLKLCGCFCSLQDKDLGAEWFRIHASPQQIHVLTTMIKGVLYREYESIGGSAKNPEATKQEKKKALDQ